MCVDFSSADTLGYIPAMRAFSGISGNDITMPHGRVPLNPIHVPFIQLVDGRRTIREIAALGASEGAPQPGAADVEDLACNVFQNLWRLDFLAMARTPAETHQLSGPVAEGAFVASAQLGVEPMTGIEPAYSAWEVDSMRVTVSGCPSVEATCEEASV
jgi:hypothetical protein